MRSLQGFARVTLEPGESKVIDFPLGFRELSFFNAENRAVVEPARYVVWIGGSSTAEQSLEFRTINPRPEKPRELRATGR